VSIGCANADTFRVDVSSSVADHIDVIYYNNRFICSPGNEDSYQWGYDDAETMDSVMIPGAVNQDYYNSAPGFGLRYWWVMNGHNGCMQKTYYNTPMSVVQTTTAVAGIEVYPNPAEGSVTVSLSNVTGRHLSLKIINAVGQTVKQIDMPGAATQIDVSDLTSGIYIIYCDEDGQRIGTSRFIKN
jgi:hypothetical protein